MEQVFTQDSIIPLKIIQIFPTLSPTPPPSRLGGVDADFIAGEGAVGVGVDELECAAEDFRHLCLEPRPESVAKRLKHQHYTEA